jgi:hypothetical protein
MISMSVDRETLRRYFHVWELMGKFSGEKEDFIRVLPRRGLAKTAPSYIRVDSADASTLIRHPGKDRLEYAFSDQQRRRSSPRDLSHLHSSSSGDSFELFSARPSRFDEDRAGPFVRVLIVNE